MVEVDFRRCTFCLLMGSEKTGRFCVERCRIITMVEGNLWCMMMNRNSSIKEEIVNIEGQVKVVGSRLYLLL